MCFLCLPPSSPRLLFIYCERLHCSSVTYTALQWALYYSFSLEKTHGMALKISSTLQHSSHFNLTSNCLGNGQPTYVSVPLSFNPLVTSSICSLRSSEVLHSSTLCFHFHFLHYETYLFNP